MFFFMSSCSEYTILIDLILGRLSVGLVMDFDGLR